MKKLLSWVLSITIVVSSVTPSLGSDSPGIFGGKGSKSSTRRRSVSSSTLAHRILPHTLLTNRSRFKDRILEGKTTGLAQEILTLPLRDKVPLLRGDFVALSLIRDGISLPQRVEAAAHYTTQLKQTHSILQVSQSDIASFLAPNVQSESYISATRIQDLLADASALSIVGTREQAPVLVDFYKQAKGTPFEDTALLIAARGLLRMEANEELGALLHENAQNPVLAGMAAYIKEHKISVEVPEGLQHLTVDQANPELAEFLGTALLLNRLHADASLEATERWMEAVVPQEMIPPELLLENESSLAVATTQQRSLLPPAPGGFVQPIRLTATLRDVKPKKVDHEDPKLHENTTRRLYVEGNLSEVVREGENDTSVEDNHVQVAVGVEGFKLTVEDESGKEQILTNVDMTIGTDLQNLAPEYNRVALDRAGTFELRNEEVDPKRPDHFFFTLLNPQNGPFAALLEGASKLNLARPLRIKIQHKTSPRQTITLPIKVVKEDGNVWPTQLVAEVDLSLLEVKKAKAERGALVVDSDGIYFQRDKSNEMEPLRRKFFIRLPKEEAPYWTKILAMYPDRQFSLGVFSTKDKIPLIACWGSFLHVGLGKTVPPVLKEKSEMSETEASYVMMGINNVLPALMIFVNPLLERYGEARVYRWGLASFVVGFGTGALLTLSSLLGHGAGLWSGPQLTLFLISSVAIALGGSITGYLRGLLALANSGIIRKGKGFQNAKTGQEVKVVYNVRYLLKRFKEVFTKKGGKSLVDLLNIQKTTMFKNLGTMAFLSFPWLTNLASKFLFNVDLGLDFTASYIPFSIVGWYTLRKAYNTGIKNSFPLDITVLHNKVKDLQSETLPQVVRRLNFALPKSIAAESVLEAQKATETKDFLGDLFRSVINPKQEDMGIIRPLRLDADMLEKYATDLNDSIKALSRMQAFKTKKAPREFAPRYEAEFGEALEQHLLQSDEMKKLAADHVRSGTWKLLPPHSLLRDPQEVALEDLAKGIRRQFRKAFDDLNGRNIKLKDVIRMAGIPTGLLAMTLATIGELGFSNNFAFAMRELLGDATTATGVVGLTLYGFMFGWRLLGNVLTQRMTGGSMYLLSSLTAVLGTAAMALSPTNMSVFIPAAIISCFGISNFYAQMYNYIMGLHDKKYKRKVALLIQLSMPVAALCTPLLRLASHYPGLDMGLVSAAMLDSVIFTPKMLADSSLVRAMGYGWQTAKTRVKDYFNHRNNGESPQLMKEAPAN